ncbi:MAG TPA: response regulator transcription factor [Bacteroidetes bacterium]|nr:response regulator transcription factor [Bacteroidota bacterium]
MNILIIEDEFPAYKKLVNYLLNILGDEFQHHHVRSVVEAHSVLSSTNTYELILSDIVLLDGTSFEVFNAVSIAIPIIFCTAFDEHLLEAFKTNGIAYILKPYSQKDLEEAIKKYEKLFPAASIQTNLFEKLSVLVGQEKKEYKKRFAIKKNFGIHLLEIADVSYIEAYGDLCKLTDTKGNLHVVSKSIGSIILDLDPSQFFRINRGQIVNINHIKKIEPFSKNRLSLKLTGCNNSITTSTARTKEFRTWLEK